MKTLLRNGAVYRNHEFVKTDMLLDGRTACAAGDDLQTDGAKVVDMIGAHAVPGFIDVYTHGTIGVGVSDTNMEGFEKICRFQVI